MSDSHASRLNNLTRREQPTPVCGDYHPLLADVRCQRLQGHPGKHGSTVTGAEPVDMTIEWSDREQQAS